MLRNLGLLALVFASFFLLACGDGAAVGPVHDGIPNNCEYTEAEYYRANAFPRFDRNNDRLTLVDWSTGETIYELAISIEADEITFLNWSPNCRYLTMRQDGDAAIYDITNGAQVAWYADVDGYTYYTTTVTWDSTSQYVTVESGENTYLKHVASGKEFLLAEHHFIRQFWDLARMQLIAMSNEGITVYDLNNGRQIAQFEDLGGEWWAAFSPDGSRVVFYMKRDDSPIISVWNRDTQTRIAINTGYYRFPRIAFSADSRYLAMGGHTLSIWDLQNPPADVEVRSPLAQVEVPGWYVDHIHFINNATIEIIDEENTVYWNFITGDLSQVTARTD